MADDAERADDDGEHALTPKDQGKPVMIEEANVINHSPKRTRWGWSLLRNICAHPGPENRYTLSFFYKGQRES